MKMKMKMKMKMPLGAEFVRSILDYAPETGIFRWRERTGYPKKWNTRYAGTIAGTLDLSGYVKITIGKGAHYPAHVLAWLYVYGEWCPNKVDHRDGNRSDNRIHMLRKTDASTNGCNKTMQRNNTSGFVGVSFHKQDGLWEARMTRDRRTVRVGLFKCAAEAAKARDAFAKTMHGEFAPTDVNRKRYRHSRDLRATH